MAGPKNQELGIKQPFRRRGGIDFDSWEGINLFSDAGAIRDTQFQVVENGRIEGNEVISRGGMEKIHETSMEGCVYGFVDVPDGATSIILVSHSDHGETPSLARLDRFYSEASPTYNEVFPVSENLQATPEDPNLMTNDDFPRRSLARFGGHLYQFGSFDNNGTDLPTLFKVVLPPRDNTLAGIASVANQAKLERVLDLPEFSSYCVRMERASDTSIIPVMYVGATTTGEVFRWDGDTLSVEDANLPSNSRIIVASFHEDIWAIAQDELVKRNGGAWDISFALPDSTFVPCAAEAFQGDLVIVGNEKVYVFNGTTVTQDHAPQGVALIPADIVSDVKVWRGAAYYTWRENSPSGAVFLGSWDGTVFVDNLQEAEGGETNYPGCLEPSGDYLYWTYGNNATPMFLTQVVSPTGRNSLYENSDDFTFPVVDMVAF